MPEPNTPEAATPPAGESVTPKSGTPLVVTSEADKVTPTAEGGEEKPDEPKPKAEGQPPAVQVLKKGDLKKPEGSLLEDSVIDEVLAYAAENKLSKEQAQSELDRQSKVVASYADRKKAELAEMSSKWYEELQNDKEFGGENLGKNAEIASRVVKKFFPEDVRKFLQETGLGNYPNFVRGFMRIGKAMSEDQLILPGSQTGGEKPIEDIFYPNSKKES